MWEIEADITVSMGFLFADILVADAERTFVRRARQGLQSAGYTVRRVARGAEVCEAMRADPPDLILMVMNLQGETACDTARRIKAADLPFVPLIMVRDDEDDVSIAEVVNAGADEFLDAGVTNAELLVRVRAMLRLKQTTDELHDLNATLEQKVAERTEALAEAHAKLRHTEKLSALGRLAASVAHDINNPLTGILNYIYLIQDQVADQPDLREDLALIERQVDAIAELVKQLQSFSKPPRKERRPVDISNILSDVLALTRKDLEKRDIDVQCQCADALPPILAAPDQIGEVFMNLVINARDAMPEGGRLDINVERQNGHVTAQVCDTGVGMPEEIRDRIFEPFFTTKGEEGTGLGLAICYRIVQEHEGDIQVASEPAQGTTFTVRLPAAGSSG